MSEPLYVIAGNILHAMDKATAIDENGEPNIDPAAYNTIDGLYDTFDTKIEACAAAMRDIEARAQAAADEAERLYGRKVSLLRHRDWLKEYIRQNMEFVGRQKVEGSLFTVRVQNTAARVEIADRTELPPEFVVVRTTESTDRAKLKEALTAGREIPGVSLVKGTTVVIR